MFKKIAHSVVSLILVISIMGPSVVQLYDTNADAVVNTIVEEEVKEKILVLTDFLNFTAENKRKNELNTFYVEVSYFFEEEILLPPPEFHS